MPNEHHDDRLDGFLKSYTAPASDDGFTELLMMRADADMARHSKLRTRMIYAAFFAGGAIAAVQIPKALGLLQRGWGAIELPTTPRLPADIDAGLLTTLSSQSPALMMAVGVIALFMVLLAADGDGLRL
jgi:hypothetical protein